jgi:hypothetical protein
MLGGPKTKNATTTAVSNRVKIKEMIRRRRQRRRNSSGWIAVLGTDDAGSPANAREVVMRTAWPLLYKRSVRSLGLADADTTRRTPLSAAFPCTCS